MRRRMRRRRRRTRKRRRRRRAREEGGGGGGEEERGGGGGERGRRERGRTLLQDRKLDDRNWPHHTLCQYRTSRRARVGRKARTWYTRKEVEEQRPGSGNALSVPDSA
eukprot:1714795-Rhodomonas_salina.1